MVEMIEAGKRRGARLFQSGYFLPLCYGLLLTFALWFLFMSIVKQDRAMTEAEIVRNNDQLTRALEEHVRSSLQAVDAKLQLMRTEYQRAGVTPAVDFVVRGVSNDPLLLQCFILDPSGRIVTSNLPGSELNNYSDRSYFQFQRQTTADTLLISEPLAGRLYGRTAIVISRRISGADGSFAGVAAFAVDPEYFTNFYRSMNLEKGRLVRIVGTDGIVRANWNFQLDELGTDIRQGPLFRSLRQSPTGSYQGPGVHHNVDRFFSYRTLPDFPLIVQVGFETEFALAEHRTRRNILLGMAIAGNLIVGSFTFAALWRERQRRKAERELRRSEQLNRTILQTTSDGYWIVDSNGRMADVNEAYLQMSGYARQEFLGLPINAIDADEDPAETAARLERILHNGSEIFEVRHRRKDGSIFDVEVSATLLPETPPTIVCFCRDISVRKSMAFELQQSEQRYRALMYQAHEAVALFDLDTLVVVEANPAFEVLSGYRFPMERPLHAFELFADEPVGIMRYVDEVHTNGVLTPTLRKIRTRDGGIRLVERAGNRIQIGNKQYQLTTLRDVTQEKQQQQQMQKDLVLAAQVQRVLLPPAPRSDYFRISIVFAPKEFVSGDVYALEWDKESNLLRGFLLDLTGHGMATALQTAAVSVLLQQVMDFSQSVSLSERLAWLNHRIPRYIDESTFAAAIGFELDFIAEQLRYASAGISHFLINGERVDVEGMYLGIRENEAYEQHCRNLQQGDAICFMTDGISDIFDREDSWGTVSAGQVCRWFHEGDLQEKTQDDATAICIVVKPRQGMEN